MGPSLVSLLRRVHTTAHFINMKIFLLCAVAFATAYATGCVEKNHEYCVKNIELCKEPGFVEFMKDVCPRTCGYCLREEEANDCVDNDPKYCRKHVDLCKEPAFKDFMKHTCKRSCGYCQYDDSDNIYSEIAANNPDNMIAQECMPPLIECKTAAGRDWIKNFQCAAAYLKCVSVDCK